MKKIFKNTFNKIIVLESLPAGEISTGKNLYENVLIWKEMNYTGLSCTFNKISNTKDIIEALEIIYNETKNNNIHPVIHIEMHGNKNGLSTSSGDFLEWNTLYPYLQRINISCQNNMLLTLAACYGIYITKISKTTKPAPFWGLVAPVKPIKSRDLEISFQSFYEEILNSHNGDIALKKLNTTYGNDEKTRYAFWPCVLIFKEAYKAYYKNNCTGKSFRGRIENLVTKVRIANPTIPITQLRRDVKNKLKNHDEYFSECRKIFFMIDKFPENDIRFPITKNDCIML
jgi:hypothetical protein